MAEGDFPDNLTRVPVTISSGASLSGAAILPGALVGIEMPATWDAADLTFQATGARGGTYQELVDDQKAAVTVKAGAATFIRLAAADWAGVQRMKVRSGTSGAPVNQTADRALYLVTRPV